MIAGGIYKEDNGFASVEYVGTKRVVNSIAAKLKNFETIRFDHGRTPDKKHRIQVYAHSL